MEIVFDVGGLIPRPVASYSDLWGRDRITLNQWCQKGWVPGAYKHESGEWWVRPLDLMGLDVESIREKEQGQRDGRKDQRPVLRQVDGGRPARLRKPTG